MAFDPALPLNNSPIVAGELRDQFNGLYQFFCSQIDARAMYPGDVEPLTLEISDPPTKAQVEAIRDKLNELLTALRGD